jgi:hypothetical protein
VLITAVSDHYVDMAVDELALDPLMEHVDDTLPCGNTNSWSQAQQGSREKKGQV